MTSLLHTLLRPDHEDEPERALVAQAANLLQIGEFQLLQLAFAEWYGKEMPVALIDKVFERYMLQSDVPAWARHYARKILDLEECGQLDYDAPHYHRYDTEFYTRVPKGLKKFVIASVFIVLFLGGGLWIAELSVRKNGSILPPYFDDRNLNAKPGTK